MSGNASSTLTKAYIVNLSSKDKVYCMFNPEEFTLSKQNTWTSKHVKGKNLPRVDFQQGGAESLKLQLFFDTYAEAKDVRECTGGLWKMMMISRENKEEKINKGRPPQVKFVWGTFSFKAVIVSLTQRFTLFLHDGTPVRSIVDISLQQVSDAEDHHKQNPTSGGGPPIRTHRVVPGERLDWIAHQAYGDATLWRLISDANDIHNPLRLRDGQILVIPSRL